MPELRAVLNVALIALACAAALAVTEHLTADRIRTNENARLRAAIATLLPETARPTLLPATFDRQPGAWRLCGGPLLGRSNAAGYGGDIRLLYTFRASEDAALIAVTVLAHQETPGIADFLADPDWLALFRGRNAADLDGMAAITGATITSRAVSDHLAAVLRAPTDRLGIPIPLDCAP